MLSFLNQLQKRRKHAVLNFAARYAVAPSDAAEIIRNMGAQPVPHVHNSPNNIFGKYTPTKLQLNKAPCRLQGCKNRPAPFPGRMSYKATKPGLVSVFSDGQ